VDLKLNLTFKIKFSLVQLLEGSQDAQT